MSVDPFDHIEEAFGLDHNPFPGEGVSAGDVGEQYSEDVFPEETREFRVKMIRGALQGNRKMGFLWSVSHTGEDTGFGKTALMRNTANAINADFGVDVQQQLGIKEKRIQKIASTFAVLNEQTVNGLYPVLFSAALHLASADGVMSRARAHMLDIFDDDRDEMYDHIVEHKQEVAPTGQALRSDVLDAFYESPQALTELLNDVSDASRLRNGVQHFAALLYILSAAGFSKTFLMLDQLEDLGKKGALSAAKRRREIGRIRDLLEIEPFASGLHTSFTFHQNAATGLEADWDANRLPSFDLDSSNSAAVVVLRGLQRDEQVAALLSAWMEPHRNENANPRITGPFAEDSLAVLRHHSQGRPGVLLRLANQLIYSGGEAAVGEIDGAFAAQQLGGGRPVAVGGGAGPGGDYDDDYGDAADDLLA